MSKHPYAYVPDQPEPPENYQDLKIHSDEWFQTFTGKRFFLGNPRHQDVDIIDIAHSLAGVARYGGMAWRLGGNIYSVSEHSLLIAWYAKNRLCLERKDILHALCHDAAEAYTGDIKRPIKNAVPGLRAAVQRIEEVVAEVLGVPADKPAWLAELDTRIVADEKNNLMGYPADGTPWSHETRGILPLGVPINCYPPDANMRTFLNLFNELN